MQQTVKQAKDLLSKTAVSVGAPVTGGMVGIVSFFEQIIPALTVVSLCTGIVLGILSYRLKLKNSRKDEED